MRFSIPTAALLSMAFSLTSTVSAVPHGKHVDHAKLANSLAKNETAAVHHFEKRFDNMRFTWFVDGLGACGVNNQPADYIVALTTQQWDNGAHCFKMVNITVGGKITQAQITDRCMGCPWGGLDFSQGLFDFFASESVGVLSGSWEFAY